MSGNIKRPNTILVNPGSVRGFGCGFGCGCGCGRGCGCGFGRGCGCVGVAVGLGVGLGVGLDVGVDVGVGVGLGVGVDVGVDVHVGMGGCVCGCGYGCGGCLGTLGHPQPRKITPKLLYLVFCPRSTLPKFGQHFQSTLPKLARKRQSVDSTQSQFSPPFYKGNSITPGSGRL